MFHIPKKLVVVSAVVAAVGVMAIPAMAQAAPFWKVGGVKIGAAKVAVTSTGSLTFTAPAAAGGIKLGPCNVKDKGNIWNGATRGEDEITEFVIETPCPTSIPGCNIVAAGTNAPPAIWASHLVAGPADVIEGIEFLNVFGPEAACGGFANKEVGAGGSVTGNFNNATSCVEFNEAEGLFVPGIAESGKLNGEDCLTTAGGAITVE